MTESTLTTSPARGLTVAEVAVRYRVSPDKVRAWINRGELAAVNTSSALCGKPRWVVLPDALAAFEKRRAGGPTPTPRGRRRPRRAGFVDYFPGDQEMERPGHRRYSMTGA